MLYGKSATMRLRVAAPDGLRRRFIGDNG